MVYSTDENIVENKISSDRLDPDYLTNKQLFSLLDSRGEVYRRSADRSRLVTLAKTKGPVTTEALAHMKRIGEPTIGPVHEFNAFNFKKTLEKYNDSIFLLNILPPRLKSSYFNESSWNALRRKLTYMDFKFGELDCDFEK
ncbi:hypothetical protein AM593_03516, partial [Mytilus galloprovincialis]